MIVIKPTEKSPLSGIVVHSTGANNPYVKRYVQPVASTPDADTLQALLRQEQVWESLEQDF
jgi:hypothetical protein